VYVFGELQFSSKTPLSQHMYVEPGTSETNVNVAAVLPVISAGPVRIVVTGGSSTIHS
jgi:hypothetical protein